MTTIQRSILVNFNRVLIFALTTTGLLIDDYQHSDLPVTLALGIWLWLAVCTRMEAKILNRARHHPARSRNRDVRLRRTAGAHHTSAKRSSGLASFGNGVAAQRLSRKDNAPQLINQAATGLFRRPGRR